MSTALSAMVTPSNHPLVFLKSLKSKSRGSFFSDEISLILFWGNTWSDKMSNQKRIGLEGTIDCGFGTAVRRGPKAIDSIVWAKLRATARGCRARQQTAVGIVASESAPLAHALL
jgi:hypothetical protein